MNYGLSPSELTFLYDGCKRCFVRKVKSGVTQPSIRLPAIFSIIGSLQKNCYAGRRTETFCPDLPAGVVTHGEKWVRSRTVQIPGSASTCYIKGRFDIVAELDNNSFAVLDFKTGNPSDEKAEMYGRQLHAYAFALENAADGALSLSPVTRLGLLYFTPDSCSQTSTFRQELGGALEWIEVSRDEQSFLAFLREVVLLLDGPEPAPNPDCDWCTYVSRVTTGTTHVILAVTPSDRVQAEPTCPKPRSTGNS